MLRWLVAPPESGDRPEIRIVHLLTHGKLVGVAGSRSGDEQLYVLGRDGVRCTTPVEA